MDGGEVLVLFVVHSRYTHIRCHIIFIPRAVGDLLKVLICVEVKVVRGEGDANARQIRSL
jgi:hypothetical protein